MDKTDLDGLPDTVVEAAKLAAKEKGELDKSEINKSLIKNVYNVSQKQLNTLGQKKVSLKKPNTVNEVFKLFLNSKRWLTLNHQNFLFLPLKISSP